jgi:hypothetical protein
LTGASSADRYAVMTKEQMISIYCPEAPGVMLRNMDIEIKPTERFANLEFLEIEDRRGFFDRRQEQGIYYASPIQT